MTDMEIHNVRIDHDGAAADVFTYSLADITGATSVVVDRANNSGATADAIFTLSGAGFTTSVTTGIKGGDTGANNSSIDVTATYQTVTGSSDAATLELNGAAANVVTIAGIETLTISALNTETSANALGVSQLNSLQAANATTVTVTGAGVVNLSGNRGATTQVAANFAATVTVNASANTGGVSFLSEANVLTFTGGTGDDAVYMAGTLTAADTVAGGTGTDTIGITSATTEVNAAGVSGFEILDISGTGGVTQNLALFTNNTGFTGIAVREQTATEVVNNIATGATLTIGGGSTAITATSDITVAITGAGLAGRNSDVINIEFVTPAGTQALDYGTIVVANTETVNIASGGNSTSDSIAVLTAAAGTNLVLTGAQELTITAFTSSTFTNIDASAMTGAFIMGAASAGTAATALTGGAGADTLIGNTGNDIFIDGAGADTITGAAGADDITVASDSGDDIILHTGTTLTALSLTTTAESLTATIAVGDTLTFGNGVDIVRGFVSGSDDFSVSAATVSFEATAPTALVGATAADLTENTIFATRGDYVESTGIFTLGASGADTIMVINDGTNADDVLSTNTNITVVLGVTALVAGDFI